MNRSMLLIISDFLIISLLALARFDQPEQTDVPDATAEDALQQIDEDMVEVLELALMSEQERREELNRNLQEREQTLEETRLSAATLAEEKARVEAERERLASMQEQLNQTLTQTQTELQRTRQERLSLEEQLSEQQARLREDLAAARERQRLMQEQLAERERILAETRQNADSLRQEREEIERQRAVLATRLETAQIERQRMELQLETLAQERQAIQEQATTLAEGVRQQAEAARQQAEAARQQAEATAAVQEEIRESQPLSLNLIYDRYRENRVPVEFRGEESLLLGSQSFTERTQTVFVEHGGRVYALFEARNTPFSYTNLNDLVTVQGRMRLGSRNLAIPAIGFLDADPRIIAVQIPPTMLEEEGFTAFRLATDPLRFPEVVLATADGVKYGEAPFRLYPGTDDYIELNSQLFNRLFGSFSPSRGDFVFTKSGELLGIMISNRVAVVLSDIQLGPTLQLGNNFNRDTATQLRDQLRPTVSP